MTAIQALTQAFLRINVLGGLDNDNPYNQGIDDALNELLAIIRQIEPKFNMAAMMQLAATLESK